MRVMAGQSAGVDRSALRLVDWDEHVAAHEARWREYWLDQPIAERLGAAMRCRSRVSGPLPPLDRTQLRVIDLRDLDT
jgi:hypothetical protein